MYDFDLTPKDFAHKMSVMKDSILLDVRTKDEFEDGHLPGALNIDFNGSDFIQQIENLDSDKEYFVYCRSGMRSAQACLKMQTHGFERLNNMLGGIVAWNSL